MAQSDYALSATAKYKIETPKGAFLPFANTLIRLRLAYGGTGDTGTSRGEYAFPHPHQKTGELGNQ